MEMSLLSPLRPVLGNGEKLIELLGNTPTFERVLQRPPPSRLWTTGRLRVRYSISQQLPWRPRLTDIRATWPAQRRNRL